MHFYLHSFIPFLKTILASLCCMAVGGMSSLASGDFSSVAIVNDTGKEPEDGTPGTTADDGTTTPADGTATEEGKQVTTGDARTLPAKVRKYLAAQKELAKTDPAAAEAVKEITTAYWTLQKQNREIEALGGLEGIKQRLGEVDEFLGASSTQEMQQELSDYRAMDQAFINGDPAFVQDAIARYPDGFKKIAPVLADRWFSLQTNPNDNPAIQWLAGKMYGEMRDKNFTANLYNAIVQLQNFDLEKSPALKAIYGLLTANYKWIEELQKYHAQTPTASASQPDPKDVAERNQVQADKLAITQQKVFTGWQGFFGPKAEAIIKREAGAGYESLSPSGKANVLANAFKAVASFCDKKPGFTEKFDAYLKAGNIQAAINLAKSTSESVIDREVAKAYKAIYSGATFASKKKDAQQANANGNANANQSGNGAGKQPQAGVTPDNSGAVLVGFDPATDIINFAASTAKANGMGLRDARDLFRQNMAVLKDGRFVKWNRGAPRGKG
jgi:hypothetical protein